MSIPVHCRYIHIIISVKWDLRGEISTKNSEIDESLFELRVHCSRVTWPFSLEKWITLLPLWLGYGMPCWKLGAQWRLKGWGFLYLACLDDWGRDDGQRRSDPLSTRKSKDPINYNVPWQFKFNSHNGSRNMIRLFKKRPHMILYRNQQFSICTGFTQFQH